MLGGEFSPVGPCAVPAPEGGGDAVAFRRLALSGGCPEQQDGPPGLDDFKEMQPVLARDADEGAQWFGAGFDGAGEREDFLPHGHRLGAFGKDFLGASGFDDGIDASGHRAIWVFDAAEEFIAGPDRVHAAAGGCESPEHGGGGNVADAREAPDVIRHESAPGQAVGEQVRRFSGRVARPCGDDFGVEGAPELVVDARPDPSPAARPRENAAEYRGFEQIAQSARAGLGHQVRVFLKAFDDALGDVVREGALALVFALALDLDELGVAPDPEQRGEAMGPVVVADAVFGGEKELRMRFESAADFEVGFRVIVQSTQPGAVDQLAVVFFAYRFAQQGEEFKVALHAVKDGVAAGVVREIVEVGFADAHNQPAEGREAPENPVDLGSQDALEHGRPELRCEVALHVVLEFPGVVGPDFVAEPPKQRFRDHHEVGPRQAFESSLAGGADFGVDPLGVALDPSQGVRVIAPEAGEFLRKIDGGLDVGVEHLSRVARAAQVGRIEKGGFKGLFAGVVVDQINAPKRPVPFGGAGARFRGGFFERLPLRHGPIKADSGIPIHPEVLLICPRWVPQMLSDSFSLPFGWGLGIFSVSRSAGGFCAISWGTGWFRGRIRWRNGRGF